MCERCVCFLLGTISGQVGELTMARVLRTGQCCGNHALRLVGKDRGRLGGVHCSCWMIGIMGVGDAG